MALVTVVVIGLLSLCCPARAADDEADILYVYTWEDYFAPDAIARFEERHNCRVDFTYYDSNETMVEAMRGGSGYDIMTPPPTAAVLFRDLGVIRPLDHGLIPNLRHIDTDSSSLQTDPEMRFSVPYTVFVTGIGYNRTMVPAEAVGSWTILSDPRLAGRMTMSNEIREVVGAALKYLGHSLNSVEPAELRAAGRVMSDWKNNLASFEVTLGKIGLQNGEFAAIQVHSGDVAPMIASNPDIAFFVPREGSSMSSDNFVIASDAPNPDLAHAFINHFLDPEMAALNMRDTLFYMPNPAAVRSLPQEVLDNPAFNVGPEVKARCELIRPLDEAGTELYEDAWSRAILFH